jgi:hypothetical protein
VHPRFQEDPPGRFVGVFLAGPVRRSLRRVGLVILIVSGLQLLLQILRRLLVRLDDQGHAIHVIDGDPARVVIRLRPFRLDIEVGVDGLRDLEGHVTEGIKLD